MKKERYYSNKRIKEVGAKYNIIFGERSNGKTYCIQAEEILKKYIETGEQGAIIRRFEEDYRGAKGQETFTGVTSSDNGNKISEMTNGKWTGIKYYSARWYLCKKDEDGKIITDDTPFCYAFCLTGVIHYKSTSYNNITTVLFDEFLTREYYLADEFVKFTDLLSTIIRDRDNVIIWMLGNTVNKYCPYFEEMGLSRVKDMKQGQIDVYEYGNSKLRVAVEWAESTESKGFKKKSNIYFAFDNPKLDMIKTGSWEMAMYPHLPYKYKESDIKYTYFILFSGETLQCEIIKLKKTENNPTCIFTYIHRKTTSLKFKPNDIIFQESYSPDKRIRRRITAPIDNMGVFLYSFYKHDKVFYQSNEIGEIVRNYLIWSSTTKIV